MSHFVALVLLPDGFTPENREEAEGAVSELLAPYNEAISVPEYEEDCSCVGSKAGREAELQMCRELGSWDDARAAFGERLESDPECIALADKAEADYRADLKAKGEEAPAGQLRWLRADACNSIWRRDFYGPRTARAQALLAEHPDKDKPDPACGFYALPEDGERPDWWPEDAKEGDRFDDGSGCGGTGRRMSTYNPKSKWDWWAIGGRWTGAFHKEDYDPRTDERNIEVCRLCSGSGARTDELALGWAVRDAVLELLESWDSGEELRGHLFKTHEGFLGIEELVFQPGAVASVGLTDEQTVALASTLVAAREAGWPCNACAGSGKTVKWSLAEYEGDVLRVTDIAEDDDGRKTPFAIVTPDGEWHQAADMGWFGMTSNETGNWGEIARGLLEKHETCIAVVVDCHI